MSEAVGIDIGGTKIAGGIVRRDGALADWVVVPSQASDPQGGAEGIVDVMAKLWGSGLVGVGVGAAGLVGGGIARYAPNLRYRDFDLAALLRATVGEGPTVVVENDANVAAWAEYRIGAGRASRFMVLVTIGTGIGGGLVFDGDLYRGAHGMGAEIGHMTLDPQGPYCGCGQRGCWERMASGSALMRMAQDAVLGVPGATILALADGDPHGVTSHHVADAAAVGDDLAMELIRRLGEWLGRGLANLGNIFDPDLFVVGGGLVALGDLFLEPAREELARGLTGARHRPGIPVVPAVLGERAGVVGAGLLALEA